MGGKTVHAFRPGAWPVHGFHPFSGQAKGQVKTAYTGLTVGRRLTQEFLKRWEGFKLSQLLQLNAASVHSTQCHHDGFAFAGAA